MQLEVNRRPDALEDLIEIWEYSFVNWGEAQANRYLDGLEEVIEGLADEAGRHLAKQVVDTPYWRIRCQSHLIVFEPSESAVDVVRVLHVSMDIAQHLQ